MRFLTIISLLRKLQLTALMAVPTDVRNSQAVRTWLKAVVDTLLVLAEMTNTKADDKVAEAALKVLDDDQAWGVIHNLVCDFIDIKDVFTGTENKDTVASIDEASKIVGTSPALIIAIVQAIISLVSLFSKK